MGTRFRKSVKVAPGVRMTVGKKSASVSIGTKGARRTFSTTGRKTTTVGIPGTGISYVSTSSSGSKKKSAASGRAEYSPRTYKVGGLLMLVVAVVALLLGLISISVGGWVFLLIGAPCLFLGLRWLKKSKPQDDDAT